jgi:hypothetical protein
LPLLLAMLFITLAAMPAAISPLILFPYAMPPALSPILCLADFHADIAIIISSASMLPSLIRYSRHDDDGAYAADIAMMPVFAYFTCQIVLPCDTLSLFSLPLIPFRRRFDRWLFLRFLAFIFAYAFSPLRISPPFRR